MTHELLTARLQMLFTEETISRISLLTSSSGEVEKVVLDVHGLTCREAMRFVKNVANLSNGIGIVKVIHGYRGGTKIKDTLQHYFSNSKFKLLPDQWNLGVTYLMPAT